MKRGKLKEEKELREYQGEIALTKYCGRRLSILTTKFERALRARCERLEKVAYLYSALFRGATPNTDMIIVTKDAYDEINAALAALKEGEG